MSFTPHPPLYPRIPPLTHWIGGWVGLRTGLDTVMRRKVPSIIFWNYESVWEILVGFFGRGIGSSQVLCLHRTAEHRETHTYIHVSSGIRTRDPRLEPNNNKQLLKLLIVHHRHFESCVSRRFYLEASWMWYY